MGGVLMLKTNVIKKEFAFTVQNIATGKLEKINVIAESEQAARLKVPENFKILEIVSQNSSAKNSGEERCNYAK